MVWIVWSGSVFPHSSFLPSVHKLDPLHGYGSISTSCFYKSYKGIRNRTVRHRKYKITSLDIILCSRELGNTVHPGFSRMGSNCVFLLSRCLTSKPSGLMYRNAELPVSAETGREMLQWFTPSCHTASALRNQVPVGSGLAAAVLT